MEIVGFRSGLAMACCLLTMGFGSSAASADGDLLAGKQKAKMCATCHGIDGLAKLPNAPNIGGESAIYLEKQLKAFRSGERKDPNMDVIASGLSDQDIVDLVAWYSSIRISVTLPE